MSSFTPRSRSDSRRRHARSTAQTQRRGGKSNKQFIHPSKFVQPALEIEEKPYEAQHTFADFDISPMLKNNVARKGYLTPSPIQDQAIIHALEGKDIIGIANTGTGKTAAFAIPVINKIMNSPNARCLVIAPTRELAQQIEEEFRSFAKGSGLYGAVLIGGSSMVSQLRDLRAKPHIVIGTPGRIKDHVERGTLKLATFNLVVLDEVDRMVDMGFIRDIRSLLDGLASPRQSLFFSATIDQNVQSLVQSFVTDPVTISVSNGSTSKNVEQDIVCYQHASEKISKLHDILISDVVSKVLVFDDTQRAVERLSKELQARGFKADAIHGGKSQGQRQRALNSFRDNNIDVLVATDVAARGIDVVDISHVVNYSTPNTYDDYTHRIGRAGRAGRKGYALTFVTNV